MITVIPFTYSEEKFITVHRYDGNSVVWDLFWGIYSCVLVHGGVDLWYEAGVHDPN